MEISDNKLGVVPIKKLFFQMSIPTLLGQLVNLLYNIVDRIYVGRIEGAGSLALAGLGVAFPIVLLISAFASLIGMGGGPRAAVAMGQNDKKTAEKILGNSITLIIVFSIILGAVFYVTKDNILMIFGASEASLSYASDYLGIYLIGTIFVMVALGLNSFITNQGFTKISMFAVVIGCVLNIILDPIFIFTFNLGVKGAAIATIISQGASALFVVCFLLSKKSILKIKLKNLKLSKIAVGLILSLGVSTFIMQATECLIQLVFNTGMQKYGNDNYVALMSIFFSISQIILLPLMGFGQGAGPIIGYNYGAKNIKRVNETLKWLVGVCLGISVFVVSLALIFPGGFISMFTGDKDLINLGIKPLRVFIFGMIIFGLQSGCQQTFVALGEAKISMFLAALRKIILLIPLAIILPKIASFGVWGLFWAEPISDIIAATATTILFVVKIKKINKEFYLENKKS